MESNTIFLENPISWTPRCSYILFKYRIRHPHRSDILLKFLNPVSALLWQFTTIPESGIRSAPTLYVKGLIRYSLHSNILRKSTYPLSAAFWIFHDSVMSDIRSGPIIFRTSESGIRSAPKYLTGIRKSENPLQLYCKPQPAPVSAPWRPQTAPVLFFSNYDRASTWFYFSARVSAAARAPKLAKKKENIRMSITRRWVYRTRTRTFVVTSM